jgi:hypothetical protein
MMRKSFPLVAAFLAAILSISSVFAVNSKQDSKKEDNQIDYETVYLFGFSFSFADSTAFLTDIQQLDSAQIGSHGILLQRGLYSDQMKSYLLDKGVELPTCIVFFSKSPKKTNKQLQKVMKRYDKEKVYWRILPQSDFKFTNPIIQ